MFHILENHRAAPFHIPTDGVSRFPFLHTLGNTCHICISSVCHPREWEVAILICICLMQMMLSLVLSGFWTHYIFINCDI